MPRTTKDNAIKNVVCVKYGVYKLSTGVFNCQNFVLPNKKSEKRYLSIKIMNENSCVIITNNNYQNYK